jgi:5-methylcytosine-specific restriction endonuclease McrA
MNYAIKIGELVVECRTADDLMEIVHRVFSKEPETETARPKRKYRKTKKARKTKGMRGVWHECSYCGTEFKPTINQIIRKSKVGRSYCSRSCGAKHEWDRKTPEQKAQKKIELCRHHQ